jgi:glycine betaine/proline transport system permease protein
MATRTQALPLAQPNLKRWWPMAVILGLAGLALLIPAEARPFPPEWNLGLRAPIDSFESQIIQNRESIPVFQYFFDPLSDVIDVGLRWAEDVLLATPWIVILAAFALLGYLLSGPRLAVACGASLFVMGLFELWEPSLQTLALMLVAVVLSVLIGLPLGILSASSDRFDRVLRPILDAMQTMPTFVYLIPVVLFFGIARVPAVVSTLVYAIPPMIRLTNLGIRQVSPPAIEAARAFGSTRAQLLFKVQLPLALPAVMAGVNQTIMMALSMVVIAALIGAGGLGRQVLVSLQRLEVGKALEAGLAIVLLAIVLDRLSEGLSKIDLADDSPRRKMLPKWVPAGLESAILTAWEAAGRAVTAPARLLASALRRAALERHAGLITSVLVIALLLLADQFLRFGSFPEDWRWFLRQPTDALVRWMRDNLFKIPVGSLLIGTGPVSDFITIYMLNPVRDLFTTILPWPVTVLAVAALAYAAGGWRLALFSGAGMFVLGLLGMWNFGMDTLSQILVTMLFTVLIAVPVGVWSSQNDTVRSLLRPILDFLQTIPSFVFLVPVIMLFNIGRVPGIIAAVLYAIAPGIKLTDLGIRQVAGEAVEAARAFGSTRAQTITKVQMPMALPSILLGVNQMIMMVLAMVIISAMVGGAGLGLEAVNGLARSETGRGMEAGIAIVILAIIMDRITQAWANKQQ